VPLVTRYFSFDEVSADQSWELLSWCRRNGADEFTISAILSPQESPRMREFFARLDLFTLPAGPRRCLSAPEAEPSIREVPLWALNDRTQELLAEALPDGFAASTYDVDLWLEDLLVYRGADFMMGVISHEGGGVLRLTEQELSTLRQAGFPDRDQVPWVGF
jgi:hypothetical protein